MGWVSKLHLLLEDAVAAVREENKPVARRLASAELFDVREFLLNSASKFHRGETLRELEFLQLSRKLEIARAPRAFYATDRLVPVPGALPLSTSEVTLLLLLLLAVYSQTADLRYINTVYKTDKPGLISPEGFELTPEIRCLTNSALEK